MSDEQPREIKNSPWRRRRGGREEHWVLTRYEKDPNSRIMKPVWEWVPCGKTSKKDPNNNEKPPRIESPGGAWQSTIIEQIEVPDVGYTYEIHEKMSDGSWHTRESSEFPDPHGKGILIPKQRVRWSLPSSPLGYESEEQLFLEVRQLFFDNLDLQDEREYDVLAAFVLMTWRFEQFDTVPYLFFIGPKESGKSRALECLEALSYRGWLATHPSLASLHHIMDAWHPTFLLDNYESLPRERRYEMEGIFNAGYRRGGAVDRVESLPEGGFKERWYEVYSPKALAGTREPSETLGSRCIKIRMSKTRKAYPRSPDAERTREIRSKLLSYRFNHLSAQEGPQLEPLNVYGRLGEILAPLTSVAPNQEVLNHLLEYGHGILLEREEEEKTTFDAQVVRALIKSKEHVKDDRIAIKSITEFLNEDLPEKEKARSWHVGRSLGRLGFRKVRMPDRSGSKGILWNQPMIERLAARYGVELASVETSLVPLHNRSDRSDGSEQVQEIESESDDLTHLTHSARVLGVSADLSPHDLVLQAVSSLTREKGEATIADLEALLAGKLSAQDIYAWMDQLVKEGLADRPDWGRWRTTRT